MPKEAPIILWFRRDLRLQDNAALLAALETGRPLIPLYIWSPGDEGDYAPGGAQRWWLHRALEKLNERLADRKSRLVLRSGPAEEVLPRLMESTGAAGVYWNRRYEQPITERDARIKKKIQEAGFDARSFNSSLLFEPWTVSTGSNRPYQVYTPFWKNVKERPVDPPVDVDLSMIGEREPEDWPESESLDSLDLLPKHTWWNKLEAAWQPTELSAVQRLHAFIKSGITDYHVDRDRPDVSGTSTLSPYLHFGHIGPRQVWSLVKQSGKAQTTGGETYLKEIVWREFAYHVLFHFPHTPNQPLRPEYQNFPWSPDSSHLKAWRRGRTGYPLVDAGMRQLYEEGWMHNRVRMVVASLLVKHLLQPWQEGEAWFRDTLVDADLASNTLGWQWAAGCGADAAPYFRVFNPITQGEKFDPEGVYIRKYVPELRNLEAPYIHQPWEAPGHVLEQAGVRLGETYPEPIIEHKSGRARALAALEALKSNGKHAS